MNEPYRASSQKATRKPRTFGLVPRARAPGTLAPPDARSARRRLFALGVGLLSLFGLGGPNRAEAAEPEATPLEADRQLAKTRRAEGPLDLISLYQDNYFLTGFGGATSNQVKFQLSAKFDLWPNRGHHGAFFAFTERSRWNLYDKSAPFAENNFLPELFYTYFHHASRYDPPPRCAFFHERVGLVHESNGEDVRSRAWNRAYVESRFSCYGETHRYFVTSLRIWAPSFGSSDNPDIHKYLGYGELSFSLGNDGWSNWLNDFDLTVHLRKGTRDWGTGSVELDGRYRPPYGGSWRFTPHLYAQLFQGFGETLLRYDQSVTAFRIGIGFSDRSPRSK